jgi:DNA-binding NarL/FixJ family response regulator
MSVDLGIRPDATVTALRQRVLIVDDAPSTRRFLGAVVGSVPSFELVGEVGTGIEAIEAAARLNTDIVLLDWSLPDMDGTLVLNEILRGSSTTKVVVVSNTVNWTEGDAYEFGATGFIRKGLPPVDLLDRLAEVLHVSIAQDADTLAMAEAPHTFARCAVTVTTKPAIRQQVNSVLTACGFQVVSEVVDESDTVRSVQAAVHMIRPAVVVLGGSGQTSELFTRIRQQSPRTAVVAYTTEWIDTALADTDRVSIVLPPDVVGLEASIRAVISAQVE